jgi:aarF domain-containing kinase
MGVFKKFLFGSSVLGLAGYGGACYAFPELRKNHYQLYKAVERSTRMGVACVRMASIYTKEGDIHEKHKAASEILCKCFQTNAGIYIKFGQMIASLDALAPEEYVHTMQRMFQQATQSQFKDVKALIETTSGKKLENTFEYFSEEPISSASIAQVHEARLKSTGERVAVKVQHNWLKEQCEGDLRLIQLAVDMGERYFPEFKYQWFTEELRRNMPKELNFTMEVQNAEKIANILKDQPNIHVPKMYKNLSNDRMIVMEFVEGIPINQIKRIKDSGVNLSDVAKLLATCFSQQIFDHGYCHADPHPGNLFIKPVANKWGKIEPQLVLLDHGIYTELDNNTKMQYSYLWKGILTQNEKLIKSAAEGLGVKDFWPLFASMVTSKTYDEIMSAEEKEMHNRLKPSTSKEEKAKLQKLAQTYHKEITEVLHHVNRDLLLVFKINDFLRTLNNQLGSPVKTVEITAKYCFDAIEQGERGQHKGFWHRMRFMYERFRTSFGITLYGYMLSIKSMFAKEAIPDVATF